MSLPFIPWYSVDKDLNLVEHAPVSLERAIIIAEEYFSRANQKFENGEDAISATLFGFSRSPSEFIEICINGPSEISYTFESSEPSASWLKKMLGYTFEYGRTLHSKQELIWHIQEFFTCSSVDIVRRIAAGGRYIA
jgi:hypothetical protein